ncbi:MAG TPA: sialidase family protein, partial [Nitriliruptorales bacterium]
MRRPPLALLLVPLLLAGCFGGGDGGDEEDEAPAPALALDCSVAPGPNLSWWPEPCLALASLNPSTAKPEVDIAVNPTDPRNIVVASKDKDPLASDGCVWSVAQVTKDGGRTWTTVYVGGDRAHRVPETQGYECVTDPIMVFDKDGGFYYALQIYDHTPRGNLAADCPTPVPVVGCPTVPDTGSAFILARSQDGGLTFDRYVVQAQGAGDLLFHDYPRMLVNPRTQAVHTIWNAYIGTGPAATVRPVVSSTYDGGWNVEAPLVLGRADDPAANLAFFSGFAATKEGEILVTMQKDEDSDGGATTAVWLWKSTDDARTFSEVGHAFDIEPTPRQHGNHSFRTPSFVEMAIDASEGNRSGRIYTFWTDDRFDVSDVLSSYSDDGVTWSPPAQVASATAGGQYFMRPRVGPDGRVFVLFATQAYSGPELLDQA